MKRKVFIQTLNILFFTATVWMPITTHFCNFMQEIKKVSCAIQQKSAEIPCCVDEYNNDVSSFSENFSCCKTNTIDNSISDNYLIQKTETNLQFTSILILFSDLSGYESLKNKNKFSGYTDFSHSFPANEDLYLNNSSLLI